MQFTQSEEFHFLPSEIQVLLPGIFYVLFERWILLHGQVKDMDFIVWSTTEVSFILLYKLGCIDHIAALYFCILLEIAQFL